MCRNTEILAQIFPERSLLQVGHIILRCKIYRTGEPPMMTNFYEGALAPARLAGRILSALSVAACTALAACGDVGPTASGVALPNQDSVPTPDPQGSPDGETLADGGHLEGSGPSLEDAAGATGWQTTSHGRDIAISATEPGILVAHPTMPGRLLYGGLPLVHPPDGLVLFERIGANETKELEGSFSHVLLGYDQGTPTATTFEQPSLGQGTWSLRYRDSSGATWNGLRLSGPGLMLTGLLQGTELRPDALGFYAGTTFIVSGGTVYGASRSGTSTLFATWDFDSSVAANVNRFYYLAAGFDASAASPTLIALENLGGQMALKRCVLGASGARTCTRVATVGIPVVSSASSVQARGSSVHLRAYLPTGESPLYVSRDGVTFTEVGVPLVGGLGGLGSAMNPRNGLQAVWITAGSLVTTVDGGATKTSSSLPDPSCSSAAIDAAGELWLLCATDLYHRPIASL